MSAAEWRRFAAVGGLDQFRRKPPLNVTRDRHCGHCGHCGRDNATASAYETPLCHPDDPALPDCYRRVTVYSEPIGALLGDGPKPAGVQAIDKRPSSMLQPVDFNDDPEPSRDH